MIDIISTFVGAIILIGPISVFAIYMMIELKNHIKEGMSKGKTFWQALLHDTRPNTIRCNFNYNVSNSNVTSAAYKHLPTNIHHIN